MFIKTTQKMICITVLILLVLPTSAFAKGHQAGMVIIASGDVFAQQDGQPQRHLQRRSKFYSGEVIVVGEKSKAQVRFLDGTILSLTSRTKLRIDAFSYNNKDGSDDANIVTLLKGGFRTITGAVAKKKPANHQVNTPVATIGVRGTNYSVAVTDDNVYVGVWAGIVYVQNDGGSIELGKSLSYDYASISDASEAPEGLLEPPQELIETVAMEEGTQTTTIDETTLTAADTQSMPAPSGETQQELSGNVYEAITTAQANATDNRLSSTEKASLDSIGIATTLSSATTYTGQATNGMNGNPVIENSVIDPNTGFADNIIRKVSTTPTAVTNITVGSKEVYWGSWNVNDAAIQTDPSDPSVQSLVSEQVYWLTAQPTDSTVLAALNTTGTWSGTVGNFEGIGDNGSAITSMSYDSTINFGNGAITNTTLLASTGTDTWNVQFLDGTLNGAGFTLTADSATSTMTRLTPAAVNGDLNGIVTGDNAEGIAAQFSLQATGGETLNGHFVSTCSTCP
jgi:hypothetical protein